MLQCHLPPAWVLDEMTMHEASILLSNAYLVNREAWEQTRMLGWTSVQPHSKKKLKMTDVMQFPWDEGVKEKDTTISTEDINRLKIQAAKIEKTWHKQHHK